MINSNMNEQKLSTKFFLRLFIPFAAAFFLSCSLRTINSVLYPTFVETFKLNARDLGIMTSAYFLSSALVQIPFGICLDKYGASKALACFLLFGVLGCIVFAFAPNTLFLFIGRGLAGAGVSGCLVGAYKAFGDWMPKDKLPLYNSMESFVGGVGGMIATSPINFVLGYMTWRTLFVILGGLILVTALVLIYFAPKGQNPNTRNESIKDQLRGMKEIIVSGRFWRLAPIAVLAQSVYLALNSLWIGPWFESVGGYSKVYVPNLLFICAFSITLGYLMNGVVASFLKVRFKIKAVTLMIIAMVIYCIILLSIIIFPQHGNILWPAFVFIGPFSLLSYPIFSSMYPDYLSGRVQTIYNMIAYIMSSAIQSGIGAAIDMYPRVNGTYNPQGFKLALTVVLVMLVASVLWLIFFRRGKGEINY